MVNLVTEWRDLEEYAKRCRYGCYQVRDAVDGIEVRVLAGKLGYIKTYRDQEDPELKRIVEFCEAEGFIKIRGAIPDEQFFTG